MNEEIKNYIKETVYLASQSTKQENSGLITHLERIMKEEISNAIEKNVNGKINNLTRLVEAHAEKDLEWKKEAQPSLEVMNQVRSFTSVTGTIFKSVVLIASVTGSIYAFFKFIVNK